MYVELHAASAFSFLRGASLLKRSSIGRRPWTIGSGAGRSRWALRDPRFHKAATAAGLKAIVGAELTLTILRPSLDGGPARPCGVPDGLSEPLPSHHHHEARGGERRRRALARQRSTAGSADSSRWPAATCSHARQHGVGGLLDRLIGIFGREQVYVELQRHLDREEARRQRSARRSGRRVSRAARRHQRRAVRGARRTSAARRLHVPAAQDHARSRRPPPGGRTPSAI